VRPTNKAAALATNIWVRSPASPVSYLTLKTYEPTQEGSQGYFSNQSNLLNPIQLLFSLTEC
jgi:hypothetical protein